MNSKSTVFQLLSLVLISCLILISCKGKNKPGESKDSASLRIEKAPPRSTPILSTEADDLIKNYKNSKKVIKTFDKYGGKKDLFRFLFNATDIDEIINRNANNTKPVDQVAFYFGHEKKIKRWHLIAYGMIAPYNIPNTGGTLLDVSVSSTRDASIFDSEVILPKPKKGNSETSRKYYKLNKPLETLDKNNNPQPLYGFAFTASQINQILGEKPDQITLDIGLELVGGDTTKIRWHVIAYGLKNGSPIDTSGAKSSNLLPAKALYFDKADPCPPCTP